MQDNNDSQVRTWGMLAHLSSLVWLPLIFVGLAFPIANIVGPLIVWTAKKNEHPFIDEQGKESLNFQISVTLYSIVLVFVLIGVVSIFALVAGTARSSGQSIFGVLLGLSFLVTIVFISIVSLIQLVLVIFAAVKANSGEIYRYPLTIRLIK